MITRTSNTIANLKNLWIEMFLNKTDKVSNIADGSVLNAVAFGTAKVAQKAIKDIAIVEAQIFPKSATGEYLDKSAALFGVSPRKLALGSSTYVRVFAQPGTQYGVGTNFISKNGIRFVVDQPFTVDSSGYGYVSVRSSITGSATNVEANSITQVNPRPLTHIECTNEYAAIGGRDYEDDETFRNRIINYNNKLSEETIESWTQIFQDLDPRILKVMNVGLGEDSKTHIYLVTQNGSFFTDAELETLLEKATPYFGLTELNLSGESIGVVLENAKWMYVGGENGVDFRVELSSNTDIATARKNIQIAMTKYLDFRFWDAGKTVQWDDLLQVVKTAEGVKYVPDEYFFPYYDEEVPLNMLPRIKAFRMRDLEGNVLYDSGTNLSNIFYPAGESDIYKGSQTTINSQRYLVSFTVTNTKNTPVPGAFVTIGNKVIVTDTNGNANILLENGEYSYSLTKANWTQQTGKFVVLNGPIFININDFEATPYPVTFTIYEGEAPLVGANVSIGIYSVDTDSTGVAKVDLEPGTYSYAITKAGFQTIESVLTVENQPVDIFERMFLTQLTVNFAVIDRERSVYVPQANIIVTDLTEKTNNDGQAEMGLQIGEYDLKVQKEGYQEYTDKITVEGKDPNCVLIELSAIPYEVKFTVLDSLTELVLPSATISINGSNYLTDEKGVAIISLPSGTFEYTAFKSGYMSYEGFVVVDGAPISQIVKLDKAFYTLRVIVRDIENGNFIQGAELNINDETRITNVNGVAQLTLGNGDYPFVITNNNYKKYEGTVTIKDQDLVQTVYLELRDTVISYTATDELTGNPIKGVHIALVNKGTQVTVDQGDTNAIGQLALAAEAGDYTWTATHKYYETVSKDITLEKLEDVSVPFTMTRKNINVDVDVFENLPGVSGSATEIRSKGMNMIEALGDDGYYYIAQCSDILETPRAATTFDLMDYVKTFRRPQDGGVNEPYDFTKGGARLDFNVRQLTPVFVTVEGTTATVEEFVQLVRSSEERNGFIDVTVTTNVSQVTNTITVNQKEFLNYSLVKEGLSISVKNTLTNAITTYKTNANGRITPSIMPGVQYEMRISEAGFYNNDGLTIVTWDFENPIPSLMEITASKQLEFRIKQANTTRPLKDAQIVVSGMSIDQTVVSGTDGSVKVYISPIAMSYVASVTDHINSTGSFTPPLANNYYDIVMGYEQFSFTTNVINEVPYDRVADNCPIIVSSNWGGTVAQGYTFSGTTDVNGEWTSNGNGKFNIPPGPYTITYAATSENSNYIQLVKQINLPEDKVVVDVLLERRTAAVTYTVKEILPEINPTAANVVKAGLTLAPYYNELSGNQSSGANVVTNASGQFTKTVYMGLSERFEVQPVVFYEGNGVVAIINWTDTKSKDLVYTNSKRVPVYVTTDFYGPLVGATVVFTGLSVDQTITTNSNGVCYTYLSPIAMNYKVTKDYYEIATKDFTPTGDEERIDIQTTVKYYPITFNVSTGGVLPPEGILVRATNRLKPELVFEGTTDFNGSLTLENVPTGPYTYAILAGEPTTADFEHPQNENGTVLDVEVKYELINAGIQVSEVYGSEGSAYLSNKTMTMSSKAGTLSINLDENGYANHLLIKGLEYTFTADSHPEFYSNPTQSYTWNEDGVIWPMNLNVTSMITVNVKDQYANTNVEGIVVAYNLQSATTDASGNVSLYRSALEKEYSLSKTGYSTTSGNINPEETSPKNVTIYRNKQTVTVNQFEAIPGLDKYALGASSFELTYTSAAGDGAILAGENTFEAYLGIPITFTIKDTSRQPFYSNYEQSHTFTAAKEVWEMDLTCSKTLVVNVKDNVPGENVPGASVVYFNQTKTTDASGNVTVYHSGVDSRNISVNATNLESYTQAVTYDQASPLNIVLTRAANPVVLVVKEVIPNQGEGFYSNLQVSYVAGLATGTLTTDASGSVTFNGYLGTDITFTVVGHPEFYSNPTATHTYAAANESYTWELNCNKDYSIKVQSNIPAGTNLANARVLYFNQAKTTNADGLVSVYRSSVSREVKVSVNYHADYSGTITSSDTSPFVITMSRSTTALKVTFDECVPFTTTAILEVATKADGSVSPNFGGVYFATPTSANQETVAYLVAKIPLGYSIEWGTNATGDSRIGKWVGGGNVGTGEWKTYAFYLRAGASGSFSTTHFFSIKGNTRPVTWQIAFATVFDLTGSNLQDKSNAEIMAACVKGKMQSRSADFNFAGGGYNGLNIYNNAGATNGVVTLTRISASGAPTFDFQIAPYSGMQMTVSPAVANTSPFTLDANGTSSVTVYMGTPITFGVVTRPNYYSNPTNSYTLTTTGQSLFFRLKCNQKITINTLANIWNTNNTLSATVNYFGQVITSSNGSFYRSGLDRELTATAQYFNDRIGTLSATEPSPTTFTLSRTTRLVNLTVQEASPTGVAYGLLSNGEILRKVPSTSNAPAGEITLDGSGFKAETVFAGIAYTYSPKNFANYYSNPNQAKSWVNEGESWKMVLNVTATIVINFKSSNYNTNLSGVTGSWNYQNANSDASGNATFYRSGITRAYTFAKTNYNSISGSIAANAASPTNLKMTETSSSITITIKDYYQSAVKGNANGCPVTMKNNSLSNITFSGSTNSSGQVSFGPMIAGTYTVSWGGGTSYWTAGSATVSMPTGSVQYNGVRLTKAANDTWYFRAATRGTTDMAFRVNSLWKPVYTTAGAATTVTLTASGGYYRVASYTYIAGITTTIGTSTAYFVTGTTTTNTPYTVTPTYNFSNVGVIRHCTAIKAVTVTVQNSLTNENVSGASISMYGIDGSSVAESATWVQPATTNASGQAVVYVSGLTNRYVVSASRYDTLNTTNANTTNFTLKLVPSEATIMIAVVNEDATTKLMGGCMVKLSNNNSTVNYAQATSEMYGTLVIKIRPGNYWWETGGDSSWGGTGGVVTDYPITVRSSTAIALYKDQTITAYCMVVGKNGWIGNKFASGDFITSGNKIYGYSGMGAYSSASTKPEYYKMPSNSEAFVGDFENKFLPSGVTTKYIHSFNIDASYDEVNILVNMTGSSRTASLRNYTGDITSNCRIIATNLMYYELRSNAQDFSILFFHIEQNGIYNTFGSYEVRNSYIDILSRSTYMVATGIYSCMNSYSIKNICIPFAFEASKGTANYNIFGINAYSTNNNFRIWYKVSTYVTPTFAILDLASTYAPLFFRRIFYNHDQFLVGILESGLLDRNNVKGKWRMSVRVFKGSSFLTDIRDVSNWKVYTNIPTSITDNLGANFWVSPDSKWLFYLPLDTSTFYSKGLNSVRAVSAMFGTTGWTGATYYVNDSSTAEIRRVLVDRFVLEMIFNWKSNKVLILAGEKGCFGDFNSSISSTPGTPPNLLVGFQYRVSKNIWQSLQMTSIDQTTCWSDYNKITNSYKPVFSIQDNKDWALSTGVFPSSSRTLNKQLSYVSPAYDTGRIGYQFELNFGND